MSHFTVLVIGKDPEQQLEPFQENNLNNCPQKYLKYFVHDKGKNIEFENEQEAKEKYGKILDEEDNDEIYGYWENPKAKWDWYVLGGRWTGFFQLKKKGKGELGEPGTFTDEATGHVADAAQKKHIDFQAMEDDAAKRARFRYENLERIFGGKIPKVKTWEEFLKEDKYKIKSGDNKGQLNYTKLRDDYNAQDGIKLKAKLRKDETIPKGDREDLMFVELDNYQVSKEEFVKQKRLEAGVPFAIIKNGEWIEKGQMGWFGQSDNEEDDELWAYKCKKLIQSLPEHTLLSLYDCHI